MICQVGLKPSVNFNVKNDVLTVLDKQVMKKLMSKTEKNFYRPTIDY